MNAHDLSLSLATDVAKSLLVAPAEVEHWRGGGRNSRIYKVRCQGQSFALKQYPSRADDARDRLGTEVAALRLMHRHGIDIIPRVMAVDRDRNFVLLSWIEGVLVSEIGDTDIDSAAAFLSSVHSLRGALEAVEQPLAAEACLSGGEVERQLRARLALLAKLRRGARSRRFSRPRVRSSLHALCGRRARPHGCERA